MGEVIRRVRPCRWAVDSRVGGEGSFPVVYENGDESYPVRWCYKRIVNGEEDNVWHKFTLSVLHRLGSEIDGPGVGGKWALA